MMDWFRNQKGRSGLFALLYFSEGAPIGFVWWAMPAYLRLQGLPVEQIAQLSALLVLPWAFKFVWSPAIDILRSGRWSYVSWIVSAQILMGVALVPLLLLNPVEDFPLIMVFLFLHAIAASTQDAAIDALAIATVPESERGRLNGWMQVGMLGGRALLGGGSLYFLNLLGFDGVVLALIGSLWLVAGFLVVLVKPDMVPTPAATYADFAKAVKNTSMGSTFWLAVLFALTGGVAFEAVGSMAGPYLVDLRFSSDAVGLFFAFPVILAMMAGALTGGRLSDRLGPSRIVVSALLIIATNIALLAYVDVRSFSPYFNMAVLGLLYVGIGLFTSSSYALFMTLTNIRLGATQFSLFMGATNACEAWATAFMGLVVASYGYATGFLAVAILSLLTLPIIQLLGLRASAKSMTIKEM